ncbi:MAG: Rossmann-like and DUF2520 domain-containing protein [Candidatus Aminicenantales bacterium]
MTGVTIIGAGRMGTSLGLALAGKRFIVRWLADHRPAAARESRRVIGQGKATTDAAKAAAAAGTVFLCVPDEEIEQVAKALARAPIDWLGKFVFHTSGILSSKVLAALKARGAFCASFHPVQSFPRKNMPPRHFRDIYIGIEGDERARREAERIARSLGARPLPIRARDKILYHAACSMAANLFVPLFDTACSLLRRAGIEDKAAVKILWPLVEGTLQTVKHFDRASALTGPISRGDAATVRRHLAALEKIPSAREIYRTLGREASKLAEKRNLPPEKIKALKRALEGT